MPKVDYLTRFDKSNMCLLVCNYISLKKIVEDKFASLDADDALAKIDQAAELVQDAYTELIKSLSDKQMRDVERFADSHDMVIEEKYACRKASRQDEVFIADMCDVMEVCKHARDYECLFCTKSEHQAKNCRLKWALDHIGYEHDGDDKYCHFRQKGLAE